MRTSHKVLISVFSVLLAASIALVVLTMNGTLKRKPDTSGTVENGNYVSTDFAQLKPVAVQSQNPLVQSDFDSIFYTFDADGNFKFYEYNGETITDYSGEVKTVTVTPECTYNKIPIVINFIVKDGKTLGYGLFTNKNNADVTLYSYVFAKLVDAPAIYSLKGRMLLLSTDPDEAYVADKTYTEIFDFNYSAGTCTPVFTQKDRNADKSGKLSERWNIITDGFLKSVNKKAAVISGKLYNTGTETFDVYDINTSSNTPDVSGMYGSYLRENPEDNSYVYLKKTSSGFKSASYLGQETEIARFDGDLKDYVFGGDWVYSVKERKIVNLINKKTINTKSVEAIDLLAANSDGTKFAAAANYKDNQALFIIDKDGNAQGYSGKNIFNSNIKNICFADKDALLITALNEDGTCTNNLIKIK